MKKFTRNFLHGGCYLWRYLRKIGLGLALVFWTSMAFAQNLDTYNLRLVSWDSCYQVDNNYQVQILMKDFIKISRFELELTYSTTYFEYNGATSIHPQLSTMHFDDSTPGTIKITWTNATQVSILPDDSESQIARINFKLKNVLHEYRLLPPMSFATDLKWTKNYGFWNLTEKCAIQDNQLVGGAITVNQKWPSVVVDSETANCFGGTTTAIVTTPANASGMWYSFNGEDYQTSDRTEVDAPSLNNTVVVKDATCISYLQHFNIDANDPLTWWTADTVYTNCPGGLGDIEILAEDGSTPYTYYVIPNEQWIAGDMMYDKLYNIAPNWETLLNKYKFSNYVIQKPAGTPQSPKFYWVNVQDANNCATINGTNMTATWQKVAVIDDKDPIVDIPLKGMDLETSCCGQCNGRIVFEIEGGTPWEDGYNIALNGNYIGRSDNFDSNRDILCSGKPCNMAVLCPGEYTFVITDALGCAYTKKYTVTEPECIDFEIGHTDAGCDQPVGELWINTASITGGSGDHKDWEWWYTTDPSWASDKHGPYELDQKITNLPGGVYYIKVIDANGCAMVWTNDTGDDAIKVLTTVFDVDIVPIKCFGGSTTAKIIFVSGDANHTIEYRLDKWVVNHWTTVKNWNSSPDFSGLTAGLYMFWVNDVTADCKIPFMKFINNPPVLMATALTASTRPPSCPGNNDGNIAIEAWGGTPFAGNTYEFEIDDRPAKIKSRVANFAVGAGTYTITVRDSNDCETIVKVKIPGGQNFIDFQDKIYVDCANDSVNLFNSQAWDTDWVCRGWSCWPVLSKNVGLDKGYLLDFDWYPYVNHVSDDDQGWFWEYWTSGGDWVQVPVQGNMYSRNPKLYWSATRYATAQALVQANLNNVVGHTTTFQAGKYYLAAKDEWGCYSNIDSVQIIEPLPLAVEHSYKDAGCANTWTGEIKVKAFNGRFDIPYSVNARYQYVLINQPDIFSYPDWYSQQVTWIDFHNDADFFNDSVLTIQVQKGTYWLAIRDYCAIHDPSQIIKLGPIDIDGKELITAESIQLTHPKCYGDLNGKIVAIGVTGGYGGYKFKLEKSGGGTGWPKNNTTGVFENLGDGTYTLTIEDSEGCTPYVKTVKLIQPALLTLELQKVDASCDGSEDGIIRYIINGGTKPYKESTNNGDNWFDIPSATAGTIVFDRMAGEGEYIVWVKDANGCMAKDTVTILDPAPITVSVKDGIVSCAQAESCGKTNPTKDGKIEVTFGGGWGVADIFNYNIELWLGSTLKGSVQTDLPGTTTFSDLAVGNYTVKVYEKASSLYTGPYVTNPDYNTVYKYPKVFPNVKQNPDANCFKSVPAKVIYPEAISYTVNYIAVKCFNSDPADDDGEIRITDVKGGKQPYKFKYTGPEGSDSISVAKGVTSHTFTGLTWGHYNVFVIDANGCQVCLDASEIERPDSLELEMFLDRNALCYNDPSGIIHAVAAGGTPPYEYAVALASDVDQYLFPEDDAAWLDDLNWQASPEFHVEGGVVWIGYVRDKNGCIQGHATNKKGQVIMQHRVTVLQPNKLVVTAWSGKTKADGKVSCYGLEDGKIKITSIAGGWGGSKYQVHVYGHDYAGAWVDTIYSNVTTNTWVGMLPASTNAADSKSDAEIPASEKYRVVLIDAYGCKSDSVLVPVRQPAEFRITIDVPQNAFICPDDLAGTYEIRVVTGGTAPFTYNFKAYNQEGDVTPVLESPGTNLFGNVPNYQGPAGLWYLATAKDFNGCYAYADTFITKPAEIVIEEIKDITCFGATKASARIKVSGDPGRTFQIRYREVDDVTWSAWSESFPSVITMSNVFGYGHLEDGFGHYIFEVKDSKGCVKTSPEKTFVPVQQKLNISVCCPQLDECTGSVTVKVNGGIKPYMVTIDGNPEAGVDENGKVITLHSGSHMIHVTDAHECTDDTTIVVGSNPVVRTATATAYVGEKVQFTDSEAGLDTMLAKGTYQFKYNFGPNSCERTLNVTVTEVARTAAIADIQGTGAASPLVGLYREITGTVTGVVAGAGYYVQDKNEAWSGIWVADPTNVVQIGNGVKVEGTISENAAGVTVLTAAKMSVVTTPAPLAIIPIVMASPQDAEQEKYESVLVQVKGARFMGTPPTNGVWTIKTTEGNDVTVDAQMYNASTQVVDGHFYNVTGVVNGATPNPYKLEPRMASDVVDLSSGATPVIDIDNLQFNVYPNPFSDELNIDNSDKLTRVTITNIAGQRVMDIQRPERVIRTSNLVSGIYVVTLFTENGIAKSERIVKR